MEFFVLGLIAGASAVGLVFNRAAWRWEASRQLMESGLVRIFETKLGMPKGTGWAALETWKAHGYGQATAWGVTPTETAFPPQE